MTINGLELTVVDEWVYAILSGDTTLVNMLGDPSSLSIFADTIPGDVVYPYILTSQMYSTDSLLSDGTTVLVIADLLIKGVDRAESYDRLTPMHQRMYQLLHQASGTTADGQVLKCVRQRQVKFPSINETIQYRHLGGIYRFWVEGP